MRAYSQLPGQFPGAENLNASPAAVCEPRMSQRRLVYLRAVVEGVERRQVHGQVACGMAGVVKAAFWNSPDQGHLAAFETDADRTAGTGRLALAAASRRLAVAAGFALAEPLAAVLGSGAGFQIV